MCKTRKLIFRENLGGYDSSSGDHECLDQMSRQFIQRPHCTEDSPSLLYLSLYSWHQLDLSTPLQVNVSEKEVEVSDYDLISFTT